MFKAQRLRGEDKIVDGHDHARDAGFQPVQVSIAGQHHELRSHATLPGAHAGWGRPVIGGDAAVFM
ncbi:hypothetical protein D3C83_60890 [compost metagenome]